MRTVRTRPICSRAGVMMQPYQTPPSSWSTSRGVRRAVLGAAQQPGLRGQRRRAARAGARPGGRSSSSATTPTSRTRRCARTPRATRSSRGHGRTRPAGRQAGQLLLPRQAGPARLAAASAASAGSCVCGITTNHCCETTARWAATSATTCGSCSTPPTRSTAGPDGTLTADELAHATATNLDGEFATVVSTRAVLGGA